MSSGSIFSDGGARSGGLLSPSHDRDSQVEDLPASGSYGGQASPWAFPPLTSCTPGGCGLGCLHEPLSGQKGRAINFLAPFSDSGASRGPHPCFTLMGLLLSRVSRMLPGVFPRERMCPTRAQKATRVRGLPPPGPLPPGPNSAFFRCLLGALPLVPWGGCRGTPSFLRLFPGGTDATVIACETVDGRLVAMGSLEDGPWGPFPGGRCVPPGGGGKESFPSTPDSFLSPDAPSKRLRFLGGRFDALPPYWLSLVFQGGLPRAGRESRDAGGFPWRPRTVPLDEGRPGPSRSGEGAGTQCEPGSFSSGPPDPGSPASGGFPRVFADFPRVPLFPQALLGAQPVKEEFFFAGDFRRGNTPPFDLFFAFWVAAEGLSSLPPGITFSLSSAPRVGCLWGFSTACMIGRLPPPDGPPCPLTGPSCPLALRREVFPGASRG
ncbi:hypothetical protein GWK47_054001 [Chionoecetes opilio]|uniref:Uncharacterized protein n=1 Tax=Chionoecetes opilio TaxID=41210 RepID=A0A8J4Y0J3_CHIOP|nr:hypothetical protein GWK47_054001 [Chionoecetes opilio]